MYRKWGKRVLDVVGAAILLVVALPVGLVIASLVRWRLGSPIFFCQQRPGRNGRPFTLYKFRTMTNARDGQGNLLPDERRLTAFGRFLRASSLDELPELWNVLKGEMSLVGPRPLLMRYLPYFSNQERLRFTVRPGITGLAQVSGRNDLSWDHRLTADVQYVQMYSLGLDLWILWQTVRMVMQRQGLQVAPATAMLDLDQERRQLPPGQELQA